MPDATAFLSASTERGVLVLTVLRRQIEGEDSAAALRQELLAAVDEHRATRVVLDLHQTVYLSSIAFWPLLAVRRHLAEQGGRLIVCGLTGAVYDVFATTKMVSAAGAPGAPFEMAPHRAAAVARLAGAEGG